MPQAEKFSDAIKRLENITEMLSLAGCADKVRIDFSVINDMGYYNGVVFKGFVNGVPDSILSGGRYDRLLNRLGKKSNALGFAVYLDRLERFENDLPEYDVSAVLLYDETANIFEVIEAQRRLSQEFSTVITARAIDPSLRYFKRFKLTKGGIVSLE